MLTNEFTVQVLSSLGRSGGDGDGVDVDAGIHDALQDALRLVFHILAPTREEDMIQAAIIGLGSVLALERAVVIHVLDHGLVGSPGGAAIGVETHAASLEQIRDSLPHVQGAGRDLLALVLGRGENPLDKGLHLNLSDRAAHHALGLGLERREVVLGHTQGNHSLADLGLHVADMRNPDLVLPLGPVDRHPERIHAHNSRPGEKRPHRAGPVVGRGHHHVRQNLVVADLQGFGQLDQHPSARPVEERAGRVDAGLALQHHLIDHTESLGVLQDLVTPLDNAERQVDVVANDGEVVFELGAAGQEEIPLAHRPAEVGQPDRVLDRHQTIDPGAKAMPWLSVEEIKKKCIFCHNSVCHCFVLLCFLSVFFIPTKQIIHQTVLKVNKDF